MNQKVPKDHLDRTYIIVKWLHDRIIAISGGEPGIRDEGGLKIPSTGLLITEVTILQRRLR